MSKLEKGLQEWVSVGLISPEQAVRIREHESTKPESSWVLSGLLALGAIIVAIGVISLIAANWSEIPDAVKLGGDFILMMALAAGAFVSWDKRPILFEALLLSFMLFCLASIGLISQIFHTGGHLYQALLFWSLITAGGAFVSRQTFVPFLWAGLMMTGLISATFDDQALKAIFQGDQRAVFMAVPLLFAAFTLISRGLAGESGPSRAFRAWILLSGLISLGVGELGEISFSSKHAYSPFAYLPGYFLTAFSAFAIWLGSEYRKVQKGLLSLALVSFLFLFHLGVLEVRSRLAYASLTIAVLGAMAVFMASLKARTLFQWCLFLLGVRFLILYFEALGGLATTGVGLIVSGVLVIGMATLWNKYRKPLAAWAERRVQ